MLLRILPLIALTLLLPPFLWEPFHRGKKLRPLRRFLIFFPTLLMMAGAIYLVITEDYTPRHNELADLFLKLFICLAVPLFWLSLFFNIGRHFHNHRGWRNLFYMFGILIACGSFYISFIGISDGTKRIERRQLTIASYELPESFDNYRIVQMTDLHLGSHGNNIQFIQRLVNMVNQEQADLIVFTGDLVNFDASEATPFLSLLGSLKAKDGIYSIMGNHDYMMYKRFPSPEARDANIKLLQQYEHNMGWKLLLNESHYIRRDTSRLALVGIEYDERQPGPQRSDLSKATCSLPRASYKPIYKILLAHDPAIWKRTVLPQSDIQLTLSGHTHGGQLKIGTFAPISLFLDEWNGTYHHQQRRLNISQGLGQALLSFRYGIWPQYDVITLKTKHR